MNPPWLVTPAKVKKAVTKIIRIARPRKVILFGSYVRGKIGWNSDLDVLVVAPNSVKNSHDESVRIRRALRGIHMPMDILVISESEFAEFADVPGLIYREAVRTGEIVYQAA